MRQLLLYFAVILLFSCKSLAPNRLLVSDKDYQFSTDTIDTVTAYVIAPFDKLELRIFSNDGFKLIDVTANTARGQFDNEVEYVINSKGETKLPVIGMVHLAGLTVEQASRMLENRYEKYYNQPFVSLKVNNRRAIVFMGDGNGKLVPLDNENSTLYDVLASAGGITELAKAYRVKVIRGDLRKPMVFLVDVSKMENLQQGSMKIMSNDIIHVEAVPDYTGRLYKRVAPLIALLTATLLVINLLQ